jgi:hypothetical protein
MGARSSFSRSPPGNIIPIDLRQKMPSTSDRKRLYLERQYQKLPCALPIAVPTKQIEDRAQIFAADLFNQTSHEPATAKRTIKRPANS